ncbi:MAG: zf-HC2 domain-containing protein [Fidelibacterota bacterium]|nr:MAG: zf-HC2 domain-containing protein [Candidatus Neomarinimicrobiota bacterium]
MSSCRKYRKMMADALYQELKPHRQQIFDAHLASCSQCAQEFKELSWTLRVMDRRRAPDVDPAYWEGYWNLLSDRLPKDKPGTIRPDWRHLLSPGAIPVRPAWVSLAAAILLVATGIFIGQSGFFSRLETGAPVQATVFDPALVAEFNQLASSYLERSKMVLMGLDNFNPRTDDPETLNISRQRSLSEELLLQGRMLRNHQVTTADPRLQMLIDEIERVLLQVANSGGEDPLWTVTLVQEGIDNNSILLRISLVEIDRDKEPAETKEPAVKTSSILT